MRMILDLRKDDFKNDFHKFAWQLLEEARAIDLQESARRYLEFAEAKKTDDDLESAKPRRKDKLSRGRVQNQNKRTRNAEKSGEDRTRKLRKTTDENGQSQKKHFPDCLNPKCDGQHFIRDCPDTPEDEKKRLKDEYHKSKRQKKTKGLDGKVGNFSTENFEDHTFLFSANCYDGAVETIALADQGSDGYVLSPHVLADPI